MKKSILIVMIMVLALVAFGCTTKEPIEEPVDEPTDNPTEVIIEPTDKVDVGNLTVLDEFEFDFDNDDEAEKIALLTAAQKDSNGEVMWDDGQDWMLVVQDTDKDYVLVNEYVQLGRIDFNVFTADEDFYISTLSPRTASLTLNLYKYDKGNDSFIMTTPYNASGNVNMMKSSGGY